MPDRVRRSLSYANVMSTLAIFVVLGGGAYAAVEKVGAKDIKRNAVRAKHIKKNQVAPRHIRRNAVTAAKIAAGAVSESRLADAAVKNRKLADGAVTTGKLVAGAVTGPTLADAAVANRNIVDGAVTGAKVDESTLGPVPNADRLDGLDSLDFVRGAGRRHGGVLFDPEGGTPTTIALDVGGTLSLECRNPASVSSDFTFTNASGSAADVWTERMQGSPLAAGPTIAYGSVANGASVAVGISGPVVLSGNGAIGFTIAVGAKVAVVTAKLIYSGGGCRAPLTIEELGA